MQILLVDETRAAALLAGALPPVCQDSWFVMLLSQVALTWEKG